MSLADRVKAAKAAEVTVEGHRDEVVQELRRKLHYKVVEGLGPMLYDRQMSDAELKLRVMEMLEWALDQEESVPLARADRVAPGRRRARERPGRRERAVQRLRGAVRPGEPRARRAHPDGPAPRGRSGGRVSR